MRLFSYLYTVVFQLTIDSIYLVTLDLEKCKIQAMLRCHKRRHVPSISVAHSESLKHGCYQRKIHIFIICVHVIHEVLVTEC